MADLTRVQQALTRSTSLADRVAARQSIYQTFLLLDVSGSMAGFCGVAEAPVTRWQALRNVLADLKLRCPRVAFGTLDAQEVRLLHPTEDLPQPGGGTPLGAAITLARNAGARRLVVISDGEPNDPVAALREAKRFGGRIDVFFVGHPDGPGQAFLATLAQAAGGTMNATDLGEPQQLTAGLRGLLGAGR